MAGEHLKRTHTSTGSKKKFTYSFWFKSNITFTSNSYFFGLGGDGSSYDDSRLYVSDGSSRALSYVASDVGISDVLTDDAIRDYGSWYHFMVVVDTTIDHATNRVKLYINGVRKDVSYTTTAAQNANISHNTAGEILLLGSYNGSSTFTAEGNYSDVFNVDGQALTPDVFGFYKDGNGYISAGTTQSTDFRPGQWVPHSPRRIKSEINRRGGFGVNGFYLPMNSSNNFGADFHCEPDTILKLKSSLPQPKAEIDGVGDYTGALREDPLKDYLVLAIPGVSGGLQNGFGDYSAAIRGSGTPKTLTLNGGIVTSSTHSYYGSAGYFNNGGASGSQFLNCTDSAFALGTSNFTLEAWIYPTSIYNFWTLLSTRPSDGPFSDAYHIGIDGNGAIGLYSDQYDVKSANGIIISNQWSHIAACRIGNTLTLYVNGVAVAVNTNYTKNLTRNALTIGRLQNFGTNLESATGYIQDLRIYKGVAKYTGGFDAPKPYTPVGIGTWRAVPDCTANNFATLNAVDNNGGVITNGNLTYTDDGSSNWNNSRATIGVSSGKYYWEMRADAISSVMCASIAGPSGNDSTDGASLGFLPGQSEGAGVTYYNNGYLYHADNQGGGSAWGASYVNGDIIGIALDLDDAGGKVWFSRNGSWQVSGNPSTGANPARSDLKTYANTWFPISGTYYINTVQSFNFGQNPTFSGNTTAGTYTDSNGKGLFKYEPPSGFLALCEDNLPAPTIKDPGEHFKTVLYSGDNSAGRRINVGFQPDFIWFKSRNAATSPVLVDSVRGFGHLNSDGTNTESTSGTLYVGGYADNGFDLNDGSLSGGNTTGRDYVAWCWKAGGEAVTNTDGSITSQVSANQDAGFSIATYTATGSTGSIGHGLGKTPAFVITKHRNLDTHWRIWHKGLSGYNYTLFFNTVGEQVQPAYSALPTDSVINLAGDLTGSYNFVTYCWAEIEGFSKFGSYVGNASTDGPFVYCGFKPAFILMKRTDTVSNWTLHDNARDSTNPANLVLYPNLSDSEFDYDRLDILSNGFKQRTTSSATNASGGIYIFAAFAESPFQTANAK